MSTEATPTITQTTSTTAAKPAATSAMTLGHKFAVALCIGLVLVLVFGAREWLREHDARMQAQATQAAQQQVIAGAQKQIDAAKADQSATAAQLAQQLGRLEEQRQQPATAADVAAQLNEILKPAQPIIVTAPVRSTPANSAAAIPSAPAVQIPQADMQGLRDYSLTCQENADKSAACARQLADSTAQLQDTQTQLTAQTKETAAWKSAAKGGSILHRLLHGAKCLAITGAVSAAGAYMDKSNPAAGAGIGALAGGTTCALF